MSDSSVCVFGHKWSKFHLIETYHNLLTQVRVCKKCGYMEAPNTPLNICKKEAIKELWNKYHANSITSFNQVTESSMIKDI
jgi:hypothetical protein